MNINPTHASAWLAGSGTTSSVATQPYRDTDGYSSFTSNAKFAGAVGSKHDVTINLGAGVSLGTNHFAAACEWTATNQLTQDLASGANDNARTAALAANGCAVIRRGSTTNQLTLTQTMADNGGVVIIIGYWGLRGNLVFPLLNAVWVPVEVPQVQIAVPQNLSVTPVAASGGPALRVTWDAEPTGHTLILQVKAAADAWPARASTDSLPSGATVVTPLGTTRTFEVQGLSAGAAYDVRAHFLASGVGVVAASATPVRATTWNVPGAPTAVMLTAGDAKLDVSWTAPTNAGGTGAAVTGYKVRWRVKDANANTQGDQPGAWNDNDGVDADSASGHAIASLTNGTVYQVEVRALNGIAPGSAWSAAAEGTPAAPTPTTPVSASALVSNIGQSHGAFANWSSSISSSAQRFTTGSDAGGYVLESIELLVQSSAPDNLRVELRAAADNGSPGDKLADLTVPSTIASRANPTAFAAPADTMLAANTSYYMVVRRISATAGGLAFTVTNSDAEDAGGRSGWSIEDTRRYFFNGAWRSGGDAFKIRVNGAVAPVSPSVTLSVDNANPAEGDTVTLTAEFNEPVPEDYRVGVANNVPVNGVTSVVGASTEYSEIPSRTIAAGQKTVTWTFTIVDDAVEEPEEPIALTPSVWHPTTFEPIPSITTYTGVVIRIQASDQPAPLPENAIWSAHLTVKRSGVFLGCNNESSGAECSAALSDNSLDYGTPPPATGLCIFANGPGASPSVSTRRSRRRPWTG